MNNFIQTYGCNIVILHDITSSRHYNIRAATGCGYGWRWPAIYGV